MPRRKLSISILLLSLFPVTSTACEVGQSIDVYRWEYWLPATVLATDGNNCYVAYDDYYEDSNEWVTPDRVRYPDFSAELPAGTSVMVLWQGEWWPATVLKSRGARYYINYDGYGANFDEWVGQDRLKLR